MQLTGILEMLMSPQKTEENTLYVNVGEQAFNYFCNCKDESIDDSLNKPLESDDYIDVRVYQNLLDGGLLPFDLEIDI